MARAPRHRRRSSSLEALLIVVLVVTACSSPGTPAQTRPPAQVHSPSPTPSTSPPSFNGTQSDEEHEKRTPLTPGRWIVGPASKEVILAFTGTPNRAALKTVITHLAGAGAPAAFFLGGRWVSTHRIDVESLLDGGHRLGNAGFRPGRLQSLPRRQLRASIKRAERSLMVAGAKPRPFLWAGERDRGLLAQAGRLGYRGVGPTARVPRVESPRRTASTILAEIRRGSIIEMNLDRDDHVAALPRILDGAARQGFGFASIDVLRRTRPVPSKALLAPGSHGPAVVRLQQRLNALTYPAGPADGTFGSMTQQAVYAFEKVHGLERDGIVDASQMEAILVSDRPAAPRREPGAYVDIDITRQVLFEVRDGKVVHTIPISTGNGAPYASSGGTRIAQTPRGDFSVSSKIPGWRVSYLGALYYPSYFYGGYAIHGSQSVPPYPASHGCVRIPMHTAEDFYARNGIGTPVFVHD